MTERIREFLRNRRNDGRGRASSSTSKSCATTISSFAKALPDSRVFYAVKANPAPEVLSLLASLGSCFDTASVAEIEMALAAGATPDRISYRQHHQEGARHRARLRARRSPVRGRLPAPRSRRSPAPRPAPSVFCRILSDCAGAEWPLSRKFGCEPEMAVDVLEHAPSVLAWSRTASRSMSARSSASCRRGTARWRWPRRCSATAASAASTCRWSTWAAAFRPSTSRTCRR